MSWLSAISGALDIGATILGIGGALQESGANEELQRYRAAIARKNAEVARAAAREATRRGEIDASDAIEQGLQAEAFHRSSTRQLIGSQRVALAHSGVMVDGGTATDIQADTAALGTIGALNIRANAERQARAIRLGAADTASTFSQQALQSEEDARLAELGAENARTAGLFNVGSTLLSGASSVAGKWYSYNQAGGSDFWSF